MPWSTIPAVGLLDAASAREGDRAAVAAGDSWQALMERAAGHLARAVLVAAAASGRSTAGGYGLRVALLVGTGDNGGDGWAAARRLERDHGARAVVVALDGVDTEVSAATRANRAAWLAMRGAVVTRVGDLDAVLARCDVAVDCLLGTGTRGAPRGSAATGVAALRRAHAAGVAVVACDVPTGVSADDGSVPGDAVTADVTVTFGGVKRGLVLHPGAAHVGRLLLGGLGGHWKTVEVNAGRTADRPVWSALTAAGAAPATLPADADKRARGRVLVVAGAPGTSGAAGLAAGGALRAGAGLVTVATPASVCAEVAGACDPGVMVRAVPADEAGSTAAEARHALPPPGDSDVVVAGPGLGTRPGAAAVVAHLRATAARLVLDADALNVHRDDPAALADHAGTLVLTPHERELARLGGGADGADAWARRVERVPALARDLDATIVAKGPGTMVAAPDGRVWVTPIGGPALGSGGTGDTLAGMIGAAIATADDVPHAVARAVWWHAAAGVRAGSLAAGRATASDLLRVLPGVLADLVRSAGTGSGRPAETGSGRAASRTRGWPTLGWEDWT